MDLGGAILAYTSFLVIAGIILAWHIGAPK